MLEAKQLTKRYGEKLALDALDLQVAPGEVYCLVGANGAGKTTTISLFLNFISPTSGAALVNGICIAEQPALAIFLKLFRFMDSYRATRILITFRPWLGVAFPGSRD